MKKRTVFSKIHFYNARLFAFLKLFVVFAILIAFTVLLIGFFPLKHPELKNYILSQLNLSGVNVESVDNVHIIFWKGISLQGLTLSTKTDKTSGFESNIRSVFLNCNVIKTYIHWEKWKKKYLPNSGDKFHDFTDNLNLSILRFKDAFDQCISIEFAGLDITFLKNDSSLFTIKNIYSQTEFNSDSSKSLKVSCSTDECNFFQNRLTHIRFSLLYENGKIIIENCSTGYKQGLVNINGAIAIDKMRLNDLHVAGSGLNISEIYEQYGKAGNLSGIADFKLNFASSPLLIDSLKIEGSLKTSLLKISDLPVQIAFAQLLSADKLKQLSFKNTETVFKKLPDSRYEISICGNGDQISFESKGWFSNDGLLEQQIEGVIKDSFVNELPRMIAASLERRDYGRFFKCKLYGTFSEPKIELDREILRKAVKNMFTNIKINLQQKSRK